MTTSVFVRCGVLVEKEREQERKGMGGGWMDGQMEMRTRLGTLSTSDNDDMTRHDTTTDE